MTALTVNVSFREEALIHTRGLMRFFVKLIDTMVQSQFDSSRPNKKFKKDIQKTKVNHLIDIFRRTC